MGAGVGGTEGSTNLSTSTQKRRSAGSLLTIIIMFFKAIRVKVGLSTPSNACIPATNHRRVSQSYTYANARARREYPLACARSLQKQTNKKQKEINCSVKLEHTHTQSILFITREHYGLFYMLIVLLVSLSDFPGGLFQPLGVISVYILYSL